MPHVHYDDQLWYQMMLVERHMQERKADDGMDSWHQRRLDRLFELGVYDWDKVDRPNDASTRSMRFTMAIGNNLLAMLQDEQRKVCSSILLLTFG